jgi:A/G-specific adenine glycosylase
MTVTEKRISKSKSKRRRKVDVSAVRARLLDWYDSARRDLPWRQDTDPYRVWVSEVMLQQTRVDVVTPYFERWLVRFPSLDDLARAEPDEVLKQWEGLGYYSRARHLHGAARIIRERLAGALPRNVDSLRALPGIGEYTAGAIASIAYGHPVAAVDGNVRRVLSRFFDVAAPTAAAVRTHAQELVDRDRPGDFNQALMELGATVCAPRNPNCPACPVNDACHSFTRGTVALRPGVKSKRSLPTDRVNTLVVLRGHEVLIARRPPRGLLANLWEFPESTALPARVRLLGEVGQVFTHKRIVYTAYLAKTARRKRRGECWVALAELRDYPMSRAQRRIQALILASAF